MISSQAQAYKTCTEILIEEDIYQKVVNDGENELVDQGSIEAEIIPNVAGGTQVVSKNLFVVYKAQHEGLSLMKS